MGISRMLLPLFFALALLSAQQAGVVHTLGHALEQSQQQDQDTQHSTACEKCAAYAQLGSALNVGPYDFVLPSFARDAIPHVATTFRPTHALAATARGPPAPLQTYA